MAKRIRKWLCRLCGCDCKGANVREIERAIYDIVEDAMNG